MTSQDATVTKGTSRTILYPMAYQPLFTVTHIGDAEKGIRYVCLGCHKEMITKKGKIKRHHFAHRAGAEQCDPDNALHEIAKAAICQGFLKALNENDEYPIMLPCDRCAKPIAVNVALPGASIATEKSAVQGTRSDLVITNGDGKSPRIIIEIVVHHDLEQRTEEKYIASEIPVVKVRPTWDTVEKLRNGVHAEESLNVKIPTCRTCRKWVATTQLQIRNAIGSNRCDPQRIGQITKDRYGSFLRSDTRRRVNINARKLADAGFIQQQSRPTLFKVKVNHWNIYADLDSTEVMRIWEVDCEPGLYAFPEEVDLPECRECVLEIFREILEQNGIKIRRYFMDHGIHNHRISEVSTESILTSLEATQ